MGMGQGAIRAGKAFVEMLIDNKPLVRGLRAAQRRLRAFGAGVQSFGRTLLAGGAAIAAPIIASVKQFISAGDQLDKMAKRTGMSVEALSELGFAAEQSGANLETLEKGVRTMQRTVNDAERGLSTAKDAFNDLGLSIDDLKGLSPEEQFKLIGDRLSKIEDPTKRAALAMMIFGRAGTQLLPMLADGAAGIEALQKEARALGLTISTEAAADAAKLGDTLNELWRIVKVGAFALGAQLAPMLIEAAKGAQQMATRGVEWVKQNRAAIVTVTKLAVKVLAAGAALVVIGGIINLLAGGIGGLIFVVKALGVAFSFLAANPVLLAIGGITLGIIALDAAMRKAHAVTREFSDSMAAARQQGDELRRTDLQRAERLKELAAKQELMNDQLDEADAIARRLQSEYGDLGIEIDRLTGHVNVAADAWDRLNDRMAEMAQAQIRRELQAIVQDMDHAKDRLKELESAWMRVLTSSGRPEIEELTNSVRDLVKKRVELRERLSQLLRGDRAALTGAGGAAAGAGMELPFELADAQTQQESENWLRRVHQLRLQQIADEEQRAIALLDERYDHEIALARGNAEAIRAIEEARQLELHALRQRFEEQALTERQGIWDANNEQFRRNEELRLRASGLKDEELQRKLLDLQERHALENARHQGLSLGLVREEFELRRKMLGLQEQGRTLQQHLATIGTFNVAALRGLFGESRAADRTADATEKTARNTKRIQQAVESGGLMFT